MREFLRSKEELLKEFGSNPQTGLTNDKAAENRAKYGENSLTRKKQDSLLKRLWDAATEPMLLMLIAAGLIALAVNIVRSVTGGEADFLECVGVFVAIALSVVISVVMEGKSAKAFEALPKINGNIKTKMGLGILIHLRRCGIKINIAEKKNVQKRSAIWGFTLKDA